MNRQALITGGTKGIGLSVANGLLKSGFDVILTYGSDSIRANEVKQDLQQKYDSNIVLLQADISDLNSIEFINQYLVDNNIALDTLIFNAGLTNRTIFLEMELSAWKTIFDANVHFPVFLIQKVYDRLKIGSSVIFTGSLMGAQPHSVSLVYGITKSTVHALVKNLVKFLEPRKIRVNAVAPGFVDTEWQKNKPADVKVSINSKMAAGRFCEPDELTNVYLMLVENQYINGEVIVVDGGYSFK
ncbi:MAG: SDR family NAD(P)-dependent oxidoreductase [Bacteroidales bacterium]|nr:SDR family NAD(P)-dependent oxidoreductase [Bacteroidales bacterium]